MSFVPFFLQFLSHIFSGFCGVYQICLNLEATLDLYSECPLDVETLLLYSSILFYPSVLLLCMLHLYNHKFNLTLFPLLLYVFFKEVGRKQEQGHIFIWTLFTLSSSLLLFLRFKMTFSIISLFQNNFASTHYLCAIIGKYITFPFVIHSTFILLLFYIVIF